MVKRYKANKVYNKQLMERNKRHFNKFKVGDRVRYLEDTYPTTPKKYIPRYTRAVYRICAKDGHKYLLRPIKPLAGSLLAKNLRALRLSGFTPDEISDEDKYFPLEKRRFAVPELVKAYSIGEDEVSPGQPPPNIFVPAPPRDGFEERVDAENQDRRERRKASKKAAKDREVQKAGN